VARDLAVAECRVAAELAEAVAERAAAVRADPGRRGPARVYGMPARAAEAPTAARTAEVLEQPVAVAVRFQL